ncbi:uncharacterized protein [Mytilus edulis]|nr:unnamed protein product [Mytilus edulis]
MDIDRTSICKFYFRLGFEYKYILKFLAEQHGIVISMRTLKRTLKGAGLRRRKSKTDVLEAALFIQDKISSGADYGYRWMHLQCTQNGLNVPRDTVEMMMKLLDPVGVKMRSKKRLRRRHYFARGPDFVWHLDSYDKLKRYGLCINGCLDGFSRQLIWLNAYSTSSNPRIIAGYYMEAVSKIKGCPSRVRGDHGTENGHVAAFQNFLAEKESFIYGPSTGNQRIESFWYILRRQCCQVWIEKLGVLVDDGLYNGDLLDKNLIQYCCMSVLQNELNDVMTTWNIHQIRPTKNQNCPHGRPMVMYMIPTSYETRSYRIEVDQDKIDVCKTECIFRQDQVCDEDIWDLCGIYMKENALSLPTSLDTAIALYKILRDLFHEDI